MYCGYVVRVEKLRPHPNANKLQILELFMTETCVGLDVAVGDIGVYFPADGQLSVAFCDYNHLCRVSSNGTLDTGYMDPEKRNVKAIRLRGERSDGIYLPIKCLEFTGIDVTLLHPGDPITVVNGVDICTKYIPKTQAHSEMNVSHGNRTRKKKVAVAPLFKEHADTEQLAYNLGVFKPGDEIEITLKMHGTSQRTGYLPVLRGYADTWPCRVGNAFRYIMRKMGCYHGEDVHDGKPIYDWGYVSGTRRVVLESYEGGFYGNNEFREQHSKVFEGKLRKGETVYYEVVGFTTSGQPIMGSVNNSKVNDKEFTKQYGKETVFSYGCHPDGVNHLTVNNGEGDPFFDPRPQSDIYVYRMTMTNEDGEVVEYTPDFMRYRCEQMGVKTVPVFAKAIINEECQFTDNDGSTEPGDAGAYVMKLAELFYDGPDPIGKTHVREGVVVRIINRPTFKAYKSKNISFKMLEGIYKEEATAPDMEEAQETIDNEQKELENNVES